MNALKATRLWSVIAVLIIIASMLASCATPTPEVIIQTVEVTKEVEVTREVIKEVQVTVEVEVPMDPSQMGVAAPLNTGVSGEVEFWHFWGSPVRRAAIQRAVAICQQKLPNIKMTEVFKPWGDIWTANVAAVAAGSGMPDVIVEDRPMLPQRARDEVATSLQPFIERDGMDSSQFWPFTWQEATYEGEVYGIPFETDLRVLFWNKQLFQEAGLDPNSPPETWDELLEYADKLDVKNEDGTYKRIGFFPLWNAGPDFWSYTTGHTFVQNGAPVVDDPKVIETLAWVKTWVDRYGGWQNVQNFKAQFGAAPNDVFMANGTAMIVDVAGYHSQLSFYRPYTTFADGSRTRMEWGISFIPYKAVKSDWSGGFALSIPKGARNPEAAWEFIKCMAGPEVQISWTRDTYALPTNKDAAYDPVLMADPYWKAIMANMEWSQGTVYVPGYSNWTEQLGPRYEKVWTGELDPATAMKEAQTSINETIAKNK